MEVAVTGASGYLGSFIVLALLRAGHAVRACARASCDHLEARGARRCPIDLFDEGRRKKIYFRHEMRAWTVLCSSLTYSLLCRIAF